MKSDDGISVVICCYNSESRITPTLQHLFKQQITPLLRWEIIIVDNLCKDKTVEVVKKVSSDANNPVEIHFVEENKPGLASARAKGIKVAKFEYIVFCDDDNWLNPHYISNGYKLLKDNPTFGIIGGHGEAVSEVVLPSWFHQERFSYATGTHYEKSKDITDERTAWSRNDYKKVFTK